MFKKLLKQFATQQECVVKVTRTNPDGGTVEATMTIIGTPDQVVEEIARLNKLADGIADDIA